MRKKEGKVQKSVAKTVKSMIILKELYFSLCMKASEGVFMVTLGKLAYGRNGDIVDLLNEYKTEIGESRMSLQDEGSLANAIREGRIEFYCAANQRWNT